MNPVLCTLLLSSLMLGGCVSTTPTFEPESTCVGPSQVPLAHLWRMDPESAANQVATARGPTIVSRFASNPGRLGFNTSHGRIVFTDDGWRLWPILEYSIDARWPT